MIKAVTWLLFVKISKFESIAIAICWIYFIITLKRVHKLRTQSLRMPLFILNEIILKFNYEKFQFVCAEIEIKFHYSWMEFFTLPIETKNFPKKFCVGCKCYTNLKFSNRHNSPPNAARESKIPPCDSESRTLSTCILRFFSKKIDLPTLFSFYQYCRKVPKCYI